MGCRRGRRRAFEYRFNIVRISLVEAVVAEVTAAAVDVDVLRWKVLVANAHEALRAAWCVCLSHHLCSRMGCTLIS